MFKSETVNKNIERLQIIEFEIGGCVYGVNILKVKEIMTRQNVTRLVSNEEISRGIFHYRGQVIPMLNMHKILGTTVILSDDARSIILYFNNMLVAFEVDRVIGTYVLDWKDVRKVDSGLVQDDSLFMGVAVKNESDLILLIDFESVMYRLKSVPDVQAVSVNRNGKKIMIADDSSMMSALIQGALTASGYTNIVAYKDGLEALGALDKAGDVDCFILDIEMPYHNGYTVTKRIRENPLLKTKPVLLFSSLVNDENMSKGVEAGATIQISKPDIVNLIAEMDKLLN